MKQLIDGKLYDTESAKKLCSSTESQEHYSTSITLYRTDKGNFFTHKYTGHKTGKVLEDSIAVASVKEAKEFYAKNGGDVTKWKDVFGEEVETA